MDHSKILLKTSPLSNIKLILFSLSFPFSAVFFSAPLILQTAPSSFVSPADNSKYTQKGEQASRRAGFIQKGHHEFCLVWIGWVLRLFGLRLDGCKILYWVQNKTFFRNICFKKKKKNFNRTVCWVFLTQPCAVCDAIKRGSGGSSGHSSVPPRPRLTTESAQFSARGKPRLPIAL